MFLQIDFPFMVLLISGGHCLLAIAQVRRRLRFLSQDLHCQLPIRRMWTSSSCWARRRTRAPREGDWLPERFSTKWREGCGSKLWTLACGTPRVRKSVVCHMFSGGAKRGQKFIHILVRIGYFSIFTVGEAVRSTCGKSHEGEKKENRFYLSSIKPSFDEIK